MTLALSPAVAQELYPFLLPWGWREALQSLRGQAPFLDTEQYSATGA